MQWAGRLLVVLALAAGIAAGDELRGQVIDAAGEPVVGAEVWVAGIGSDRREMVPDGELLASATTDADGRFELAYEPARRQMRPIVLALKAGFALDGLELSAASGALVLMLRQPTATSLTFVDTEGTPLAGARVSLARLTMSDETRPHTRMLDVPAGLQERLRSMTDARGLVALDMLPARCTATFEVITVDWGTIRVTARAGSDLTFEIGQPGSVSGRVVGPAAGELGGLSVSLIGNYPDPIRSRLVNGYSAGVGATTDDEGRFSVPVLPPGSYHAYVSPGAKSTWSMGVPVQFTVDTGESTDGVEIALRRGWPVTGRVVEAGSGEPLAGIKVTISAGSMDHFFNKGLTDAEGKFSIYAQVRRVDVRVTSPRGYLAPPGSLQVDVVDGAGASVEDIELERAATVTGVVVDETGEPVGGAQIWATGDVPSIYSLSTVTDAAGRFEVAKLPIGAEFKLYASSAKSLTEQAVTVVAAAENEPLEVVVKEAAAGFMTGRVVDDLGEPIVGQDVEVGWRDAIRASTFYRRLRTVTTDAEGRYETGALVPGVAWRANVAGDRAVFIAALAEDVPADDSWVCVRGETHEVPDMIRIIANRTLAGVVVDMDGQPMAGVRVFNTGDGPAPLTSVTDADGHFELKGLWHGMAWAFAQAPGHHTGRAGGETSADALTITLVPEDVRADAPGNPVNHFSQDRWTVASELMLEVLEQMPAEHDLLRVEAMGVLARADQSVLARQMWEAEGRPWERSFAADYALALDHEAAMDWLVQSESEDKAEVLIAVGRLAARDQSPTLAAKAFNSAATAAEAGPTDGRRVQALAEAGEGLLLLGDASGAALVRGAAELVEELDDHEYMAHFAHVAVVKAMALVDVDEALAIAREKFRIGKMPTPQADPTLYHVASIVARTDPDRALEITKMAYGGFGVMGGPAQVVWAMYDANPARALECARAFSDLLERALAVGYLALRVDDEEQSWALVEEAAATVDALAVRLQGGLWEHSYALAAARLAWIAHEARYPDVQRLVTMALALRPPRSRTGAEMGGMTGLRDLALALAWVDVGVARALIGTVLSSLEELTLDMRWSKILWAMAVVDPQWAATKTREMAAIQPEDYMGSRWRAPMSLASFLVLTRDEQMWESADGWMPGKWENE